MTRNYPYDENLVVYESDKWKLLANYFVVGTRIVALLSCCYKYITSIFLMQACMRIFYKLMMPINLVVMGLQ